MKQNRDFVRRLLAFTSGVFLLAGSAGPVLALHPRSHGRRTRIPHDRQADEKWNWHLARAKQLRQTKPGGPRSAARALVSSDVNDMVVLQGDAFTVAPENPFDLVGRSVTFTPSGTGYTAATTVAGLDPNVGTKLDFAGGAAVNPTEADPGDDAYLVQNLGFSFRFYGATYTQIAIVTNGNVVFRPAGVAQATFDRQAVDAGESLTGLKEGPPRIAPYWHDLDARPGSLTATAGIYFRRDAGRVVVTWYNIRDFPNASSDTGTQRFQLTLLANGGIVFAYERIQLTGEAIAGISPGASPDIPTLVNLSAGTGNPLSTPVAEVFSTSTVVDDFAVLNDFFSLHRDDFDFVYLMTDFRSDLGDAAAFYAPIRNQIQGIGDTTYDRDPGGGIVGGTRIQGYLNLADITGTYPDSPVTRFLGANHALSVFGQEQAHRWGTFVQYPGPAPDILLGRDRQHWSFFMNVESTLSRPGVRRSSSSEGNVWQDNGDGTFTSVNLIDGYTRLDHYLMGLRPPSEVPDTFVIADPTTRRFAPGSSPRPDVTTGGTKQVVTINQIVQRNGARVPDSTGAPKNLRAAWILLTQPGTDAAASTIAKVLRFRLAWESYFAQSTDYLAVLNTGLAESDGSRVISVVSAANYSPVLPPGSIGTIFGKGLTSGGTEQTSSTNLPATLAGTQVLVDGVAAGLFLASPGQINFLVPASTASTTRTPALNSSTSLVEVMSGGQLIRAGTFQVAPASPSIFTSDGTGSGAASALDATTFQGPPFSPRLAAGGQNIVAVFGTGSGASSNQASSFEARVDGTAAALSYVGPAPGFPGLDQFNVVLPAGIAPGSHTLVVRTNGIPSNPTTLTVR